MFLRLFLLTSMLLSNPVLAEGVVSAKSDGVKVFAAADAKSQVISTLKKDQSLKAGERQGMFWPVVLTDGRKGFVMFTQVARAANQNPSNLNQAIRSAATDSRDVDGVKSGRSRSAVMGVRGLDESSETASAGNVQPNLRMVYGMEDRNVPDKNVEKLQTLIQDEVEHKMQGSNP